MVKLFTSDIDKYLTFLLPSIKIKTVSGFNFSYAFALAIDTPLTYPSSVIYPTFILSNDIDPKKGLARSKRKGNNDLRYENMHISFHRKVRTSFLKIAKKNKSRIKIIDAGQDKNKISENIWKILGKSKRI